MLTSEQEEVNVHDTSSHVEGTPVFQSTGSGEPIGEVLFPTLQLLVSFL